MATLWGRMGALKSSMTQADPQIPRTFSNNGLKWAICSVRSEGPALVQSPCAVRACVIVLAEARSDSPAAN